MFADVFLYGRTRTYDYFDMYIPSWLSAGTDEYSEYRKTVSFIMKIRDILPENQLHILENTADSFFFVRGRKISMLCRFCHVCGRDEFDRPICSTEGFAVRNENLAEFWKLVPDITAKLSSAEKTYYEIYTEKNGSETKPQSEFRNEEITPGAYSPVKSGQFDELRNAVTKTSRPFSFAFGKYEKSLYSYAAGDDPEIRAYFVSDECTEISDESETRSEADLGGLDVYAVIVKTPQGKLKYRVALCRSDSTLTPGSIAYESYEREAGTEIKLSEIFRMYSSVNEYLAEHGTDEKSMRKCIPYSSETEAEYTGSSRVLEYSPPQTQKRSILQILKGDRGPDFTEYISLKTENGDVKLSEISGILKMQDDSSVRLVSYEKLMEAAD